MRAGHSALVVIYDEGGYGMVIALYRKLGADRDTMVFRDTDFVASGRARGARAATVRSVADLAAAHDWQAEGAKGAFLLDCKVVPDVVAACLSGLTSVISEPSR